MTVNCLIPASPKPSGKKQISDSGLTFFTHMLSVQFSSTPLALQNHRHGLLTQCPLFTMHQAHVQCLIDPKSPLLKQRPPMISSPPHQPPNSLSCQISSARRCVLVMLKLLLRGMGSRAGVTDAS